MQTAPLPMDRFRYACTAMNADLSLVLRMIHAPLARPRLREIWSKSSVSPKVRIGDAVLKGLHARPVP